MSSPAWTPATSKSWVSVGVQAGVPGYSVNLLLFTYWYFSSGHLDLVVAGVRISISPKYLYLYLALKLLTVARRGMHGGVCMHGRGCTWWGGACPPVNRMTDACKKITLPQTSFAGGKNLRIRNKLPHFNSQHARRLCSIPLSFTQCLWN